MAELSSERIFSCLQSTFFIAWISYFHMYQKALRVPAHYLYVYSDLAYSGHRDGLTMGTLRVAYIPINQDRDNTHNNWIVRRDNIVKKYQLSAQIYDGR